MNTQDLDPFIQKSIILGHKICKTAKAVRPFFPQNGTLKLSVEFSDHFHKANIVFMRKTSGEKKQHKIDPAAFKLLDNSNGIGVLQNILQLLENTNGADTNGTVHLLQTRAEEKA